MKKIDGKNLKQNLTPETLADAVGNEITLSACVHKIKNSGSFYFIMLRTGRYIFQSVYSREMCEGKFEELCEGAYITATGLVRKEDRSDDGYEITLIRFEILSKPKEEYPLPVSSNHIGCSVETSMEYRSVALRHPEERAVFKINEGVLTAFRAFMLENGFTEIHTPKIVPVNMENSKNAFKLKYFGKNAYLAQSAQFYKQSCVAVFDRVFEAGNAYRAEKHNSGRHLNEFVSLDFEMAYIEDIHDIMAIETVLLKYIIKYIQKYYKLELNILNAAMPSVKNIPCVTFSEVLDILGKSGEQFDLDPTDEVKLCRWAKENHSSDFIFVERFPASKRPFYMMNSKENPFLSETFDLLFRGVEIASGGQRIHSYNEQAAKLEQYKISPETAEICLEIQRYGVPPHGGLGMGLERFVMKLLNLENIRQASLFPRDLHHLEP